MTVILAPTNIQILLDRVGHFTEALFQAAEQTDRDATISEEIWAHFREAGLGIAALPEELGGVGLGETDRIGELFNILRLLGGGDLSVARLFEGHVNAIGLVCRYGSRSQIVDLAESVHAGALSAVWGADDANGLQFVTQSSETVLKGRKILASGAGFVGRPLVTVSDPDGQQLCLLNLDRTCPVDLSGWLAQGMRSTATGTIDLSGIAIQPRNIIGAPGDFMRQPLFSGGAWRFCAAHLGATERLVDLFRSHLISRGRGEDAYQLQRLAICVAAAKTAQFWIAEAARRLGCEEQDAASVVAFANLTRMVTERSALDVMEAVQRGVGLASLVRPHPIERICRDLSTYLRQPVPDRAMSDGASTFLHSSLPVGEF